MKKSSTGFLQIVIVLIGLATLALMLIESHFEGRNAHATLFEIYFKDPFLAYAYIASIPFFTALYHAFKILGYAGENNAFTKTAVDALRLIKRCGIAMICFAAGGATIILIQESDDRPPGIMMSALILLIALVITASASLFERISQNAVDLKSENELTI